MIDINVSGLTVFKKIICKHIFICLTAFVVTLETVCHSNTKYRGDTYSHYWHSDFNLYMRNKILFSKSMQHSPVYPASLPGNPGMMTSPTQGQLQCNIFAEEFSTRLSSLDKKSLSCMNVTLCIIPARIKRHRKGEVKNTGYTNMRTASFQSLNETTEVQGKRNSKKNIYLNLY